jgi:hypothetical protein
MQKPTQLVIAESAWRKSSLSGGSGQCVEVAHSGEFIAVRDSKNKAQQPLIFTKDEWRAFLGGVELREFDVKE